MYHLYQLFGDFWDWPREKNNLRERKINKIP
jgi:hypothetical protein